VVENKTKICTTVTGL